MKVIDVTGSRLKTALIWALAAVVPGGLPILALWVAFRAAKERAILSRGEPRVVATPAAPASGGAQVCPGSA